jgi:hypothetical protein
LAKARETGFKPTGNLDDFAECRWSCLLGHRLTRFLELLPGRGVASDADEICEELAGLPSQLRDQEEDAKQFDLLLLSTQLALLNAGSDFDKLKGKVRAICHLLELQDSIPASGRWLDWRGRRQSRLWTNS